jgi:MSHA biogenesis protein MshL
MGLITVRANGQALMRIKSFLDSVIEDALARVEIEAAIVEVSLTGDMAYGIKWDQILKDSIDARSSFGFDGSSMVNGGSTSLTMTTASTNTILNALSKKTGLSVISQPKLITMNHTSALLFDGTQIPYLGTASNGAASTTGMTTGPTGAVSYAVDGLSLSILPDIINNNEVSVSIVPVISSVTGMTNFALGAATLTAPNQKVKQSFADILTQSGKTTILAGSRYKNETGNRTEVPGIGSIPLFGNLFASESNNNTDRELVIMIRTNVIPYHGEIQIIQESI